MKKYAELRAEVRRFCSDAAQCGLCNDLEQQAAFRRITARLDEISTAHPEFDAMKMRRAYYDLLPEAIPVKLFRDAPFYFAVGINGGWAVSPGQWFFGKFGKVIEENVPPLSGLFGTEYLRGGFPAGIPGHLQFFPLLFPDEQGPFPNGLQKTEIKKAGIISRSTHKTVSSKESPMQILFPRKTCFLAYDVTSQGPKVKRCS